MAQREVSDELLVRLPRSVVEEMRARAYSPWDRVVAWCDALVEHNPEPIKPGDWVKLQVGPGWEGGAVCCLVLATGVGGTGDMAVVIGWWIDHVSSWTKRLSVAGAVRCGPHPDPVIRARILKAAGR